MHTDFRIKHFKANYFILFLGMQRVCIFFSEIQNEKKMIKIPVAYFVFQTINPSLQLLYHMSECNTSVFPEVNCGTGSNPVQHHLCLWVQPTPACKLSHKPQPRKPGSKPERLLTPAHTSRTHKLKLQCEAEYSEHAVSEPVCEYCHSHESVKVSAYWKFLQLWYPQCLFICFKRPLTYD